MTPGGLQAQPVGAGLLVPTALELREDSVVAHWLFARDTLRSAERRLPPAEFRGSLIQTIRPTISDGAGTNYTWVKGGMGGPADVAPAAWPGWSQYVPTVPPDASEVTLHIAQMAWVFRLSDL